mgnify:CR=1 FL=1
MRDNKNLFNFNGLLYFYSKGISFFHKILDSLLGIVLYVMIYNNGSLQNLFVNHEFYLFSIILFLLLPIHGIYKSSRRGSLYSILKKIFLTFITIVSGLLVVGFLIGNKSNFYTQGFYYWSISFLFTLFLNHLIILLFLRFYRTFGGNSREILFWGDFQSVNSFFEEISRNNWMGYKIKAWFAPYPPKLTYSHQNNYSLTGIGLEDLKNWLKNNKVDRIFFSFQDSNREYLEEILKVFGDTSIPITYVPEWLSKNMQFKTNYVGQQFCIDLWGIQERLIEIKLKRVVDIVASSFFIILSSPLLLLISLTIILKNDGPIFFTQDRNGLNGKVFKIFKFRTMTVQNNDNNAEIKQAIVNDPRVTRIGKLLRRYSLDELPQLFNVLIGDMSLVGPRPHATIHNEMYRKKISGYMQRHSSLPGLTGLAQLEGLRGETNTIELMERRIEADLRYQREWSLALDLKILIKTILTFLFKKAY